MFYSKNYFVNVNTIHVSVMQVKIATEVTETQFKITRISRKKDYYWRVRAANEVGLAEPTMPVMLRKKDGKHRFLFQENYSWCI